MKLACTSALLMIALLPLACGGEGLDPEDPSSGGTNGAGENGSVPGTGGSGETGGTGGDSEAPGSGGESAGSGGSTQLPQGDTLFVDGRHLYDRCGEKVVLKGPNHMAIYMDRAGAAIPEIAQTGANTVRIMWFATHDVAITEAETIVAATIDAGMIPILEMHDATGPDNWGLMGDIVDYWTSDAAVELIERYEANLIVNIANEAGPFSGQGYDEFEATYRTAITALRDAGIRVPLMVDASHWGRDEGVLMATGPNLIEHDPLSNVILSWHVYDPLTTTEITTALEAAVAADLPFVIGEFANRSPPGCGPAIPYTHLIAEANRLEIGWLPWSWGLDPTSTYVNADCAEFDMTAGTSFDTLERWGLEVAVSDTNSLQNTSVRPYSIVHGECE